MAKATLKIKVAPGSRKSEFVGWHGDELKIRVKAPPEKGKANAEVIKLLAKAMDLPNDQIDISSGHASQRKTVVFAGIDQTLLAKKINQIIDSGP